MYLPEYTLANSGHICEYTLDLNFLISGWCWDDAFASAPNAPNTNIVDGLLTLNSRWSHKKAFRLNSSNILAGSGMTATPRAISSLIYGLAWVDIILFILTGNLKWINWQ
jgi:hypothetical protein